MKTYQPGDTRNTSAYSLEPMEIDPQSPGIIASSEQAQKGVKPDNNPYRTNLPLGSVDYIYMQNKEITLNNPKPIPTFKQQFLYSFLPKKYSNYISLSIPQARRFVKDLGPYMILLYLFTFVAFLFINPDINLWIMGTLLPIIKQLMSVELILKIVTALAFELAILILLWPIYHRFWSMVIRQIGKLYLKISGKKVAPKNLYIISLYTFVPFRVLVCIPFFIPNTVAAVIVAGIIKSLDVIITITYMCVATSYVD